MKRTPLVRKTPMKRGSTLLARTRIRPRSAKMTKVYVKRRALVDEMIDGRALCEMLPGCTRVATCLHEVWTRGRSGDTEHAILCRANVKRSCDPCNTWASDNPGPAEGLGLIVPGHHGCLCGWKGRAS